MPLFQGSTVAQIDMSSTTGTITPVSASAESKTLLAANANRKGATIHNLSTASLHLALAGTASTGSFTVLLETSDYYEVPYQYTGIISGIWMSENGGAMVTELT